MASNPINVSTAQANAFAAAYKAASAPAPAASSSGGGSSAPAAAPAAPAGISSGAGGYVAPVSTNGSSAPAAAPSTTPAAPAAPANTGISSSQAANTPAQYYPRQISGASDPAFAAAQAGQTPSTTPPTADDFFAKIYAQLAPVIDAIGQNEASAETQANIAARKAESATNAGLNSRGMAGSSEANAEQGQVDEARNAAIQSAKATQATAMANLVQWAVPQAYTEFQDALTHYDTQSAAYIKSKQDQATNTVASLAKNGISLDEVKSVHPDEYNQLVQYFNGDENLMRATYIGSIPAASMIGDPVYNGSKATFLYVDPITHAYKSTTIDTGTNLDAKNTEVKTVAGVGVVVVDKATGQAQVIGGTDNPYYMANQAATLEQKNQRITATKALIATKLIGPQINKDASIQNYMAVAPIMDRIKSAAGEITSSGINETNAAALLDDITKLNTQGQAITQGQVGLTESSLSYADQAKVLLQKVSGSGGVITPKVASDIVKLANDNYALYQKAYQDHVAIYNARLKNTPNGDLSAYSPLTDISNLGSVVDGSYANSLQSTLQTPASTASAGNNSLGVDNGDGTVTAPDGTVYTLTE